MPSIHIGEAVFEVLTEEYGYNGAKKRVKELAEEEAKEVRDSE
jgi:hypothetical protein